VLQRGPHRREWRPGFCTLAHVRTLDLVISVDSMPAHLAGALGVPVWTLLHHEPDWRWMSHGNRSPWYPTMRLFRQPHPGDWKPVIALVAAELARAARTHARGVSLHGAP
jgi:ADP-heptose:LPS heptosyltransferase